ncbi:trypsin-7-like [Epargyreus clarus]|uniref:trypsin-7-like n=1 Tax=Epargyreus clarus TaxID=520877 RepID=UPI003C303419
MENLHIWSIAFVLLSFTFQDGLSRRHVRRNPDGKIVGGSETTIENAPYQVYLLLQKGTEYYQCGGSIISRRYILTAAHCVQGIQRIYVRAGSTDADNGGTNYVTTTYIQHPLYNARTLDYDVAVIRLRRNMNIDGTTTKIISLAASNTAIANGTDVYVTGWGATSENGETTSTLMGLNVPVIPNSDCRRSYSSLTDRMFCAGVPEGGKDSCQGDSGGPAVSTSSGQQLGIVSFGVGCARPGYPGVYTNIAAVRDWIWISSGV